MITITSLFKFKIILTFFLISSISNSQSIASYDITFTSEWDQASTLPGGAHWSKLVGAIHNDGVIFLEMDEMASPGIKKVAEEGANTIFMNEVNSSIYADQWIEESFSGGALGSATWANIEVSEDFPLVSLASMIAPSPDWFIGINSFSLLDSEGDWKTGTIVIDMFPYDAGTDSGSEYTSPNIETVPQVTITSLQGISPFNSNRIGTLEITFNSVLGIDDELGLNRIKIFPNPANDIVTLSNIENKNINAIEIYSILGELVQNTEIKSSVNSVEINLEALHNGIYLMKINTTNGVSKTQKLLIE